jgi:RHS repeat-associated protein
MDAESGLYNYGYRYYHLQLGRWPTSHQPILTIQGTLPVLRADLIS